MQQNNEFKGFSLFIDQDEPLRSRNRGVVLANIAEDYTNKEKKISAKGAALMLGYMNLIPAEERKATTEAFIKSMYERGFALEAAAQ